jgi:collagenase-like PrtC family protease
MYEKEYAWSCAAAQELGWLPQTIFSQWALETGWFKSYNYTHNNNIAGQTWYKGCGYPIGSPRPAEEGGNYIQYPDPVLGYVAFIKANLRRYGKVKEGKTVSEQVKALKDGGWAADPDYVSKVMSVYRTCLDKGYFNRPVVKTIPVNSAPVIHTKPVSIVDYLKAHGWKADFESRRTYAFNMGTVKDKRHYSGTAEQNTDLLNRMVKKYGM